MFRGLIDQNKTQAENAYFYEQDNAQIDETWDGDEIHIGDTTWEYGGEKCFDDLDNLRKFMAHIGAERRVEE